MDAITLLKEDHRNVEKLFKRFERAGKDAHAEKREIVDLIIEELSKHASVEEQFFYPVTRGTVPAVEDVALESLEEHHVVKLVLAELEKLDAEDERFVPKVTVLMENVRHHIGEEEDDYFPKVRAELSRKVLADLGETMAQGRAMAPTHPHPNAPDTPPGNLVAGPAAGMVDKVVDTVSGLAQGSIAAAQDIIDSILGSKSEVKASSPTGTRQARKTATKVRARAGEAADEIERRASEATDDVRRTARKATKRAAKKATKASGEARRTARTATKRAAKKATKASSEARRTTRTATKRAAKKASRATTTAKRAVKSAAK